MPSAHCPVPTAIAQRYVLDAAFLPLVYRLLSVLPAALVTSSPQLVLAAMSRPALVVALTVTLHLLVLSLVCPCLVSSLRPLNRTALPTSPSYSTPYEAVRGVPYTVTYDHRAIIVNNVRTLLLSGSVHYPRFATADWAHQMAMARLSGLNTIQTYVFWNWHEPHRRQYDFDSEGHQLTHFLDLAAQYGLFVNLRVGPFVCSEWSLGGIPYWMRDFEGVEFRTNNTRWQYEMSTFFAVIMKLVDPWSAIPPRPYQLG